MAWYNQVSTAYPYSYVEPVSSGPSPVPTPAGKPTPAPVAPPQYANRYITPGFSLFPTPTQAVEPITPTPSLGGGSSGGFSSMENITPAAIPPSTGGGGTSGGGGSDWGSVYRTKYPGWSEREAEEDWKAHGSLSMDAINAEIARRDAEARSGIESAYGGYFSQLDQMLNEGLPAQKTAQEQLAASQYTGGVSALQPQKEQQLMTAAAQKEETTQQQGKTLRDLGATIRNAFMTGNIHLGARGAGDSSAANQYAYALTKLASQARGDLQTRFATIFNDINNRITNIGNIYNAEVNRLASERDQKIADISQWFATTQQQIAQAKAQGLLEKGKDLASLSQNLLTQALGQLDRIQTAAVNKQTALDEWALNQETLTQQAGTNIRNALASGYAYPTVPSIVGTPIIDTYGGGLTTPRAYYGYGGPATEEKKKGLFDTPGVYYTSTGEGYSSAYPYSQ